MSQPMDSMIDQPGMSFGARFLLLVVAVGSIVGALVLVFHEGQRSSPPTPIPAPAQAITAPAPVGNGDRVSIGIAYGTEKRAWLEGAAREFAATPEGQKIDVRLIPLGSLQAAQRIWQKDQTINVWSPASALYKDLFVQEWKAQNQGEDPIGKEESLALTPMTFVMWEERYQACVKKYGAVNFDTISQAMQEKTGWDAIAGKPDWMFFKFSHTDPNESNSGLMTLVLMGYNRFNKSRGLAGRELTDASFQSFADSIESGLVAPIGSLSNSTGNLMEDMVRKGPSTYDVIFVYESVAIDQLRKAEGRWDKLRVIYPKYNMWNDNPYYVLNVP